MKKTTYKQSSACKNFYNAIKFAAAKKFNVLSNHVTVIGNSASYPDSIALPTDVFMSEVIGFARYDSTGKTVGQYAARVEDVMKVFQQMLSDNASVVTRGIQGIDQTCRLKWNYIEQFAIEL